ncbi:MAG: hypothetical protein AAGF87_07000 [Bacteroidota bacterium]
MNLIKVRRTRANIDEPAVRLSNGRFHFNSRFAKDAELSKYQFVEYHYDPDKRIIAFDFFIEKQPSDSFKLGNNKTNNFRSSMGEFLPKQNWIASVMNFPDSTMRSFVAAQIGRNRWKIDLRPSFEFRVNTADRLEIDDSACGIYRYIRNDEVVYIGKGNIRNRLGDKTRQNWDFDVVEYSLIRDEDRQFYWEAYWIDLHRERHQKLPVYNLIRGQKKQKQN